MGHREDCYKEHKEQLKMNKKAKEANRRNWAKGTNRRDSQKKYKRPKHMKRCYL